MKNQFLDQLSFLLDSTADIKKSGITPEITIKNPANQSVNPELVSYNTQCKQNETDLLFVKGNFNKDSLDQGASAIKIDIDGLSQSLLRLREQKVSNTEILKSALGWIGINENEPIYKAGIELAKKADVMQENAYHNNDHLRDVTILTLNLLAVKVVTEKILPTYETTQKNISYNINNADLHLSQEEKELMALTVISAVSHDLSHDGIGNNRMEANSKKYIPFYLEKIAAKVAREEMEKQGVEEVLINATEAMIYTTDTAEGYKILKNPQNADQHNIDRNIVAQMRNPAVLNMANIIRDADLLGSSGLTPGYLEEQTRRLSDEIHFNIDSKGVSGFLEKMVEKFYSPEGQVFDENFHYLINLNKARVNNQDLKDKRLEDVENFYASDVENKQPKKAPFKI